MVIDDNPRGLPELKRASSDRRDETKPGGLPEKKLRERQTVRGSAVVRSPDTCTERCKAAAERRSGTKRTNSRTLEQQKKDCEPFTVGS